MIFDIDGNVLDSAQKATPRFLPYLGGIGNGDTSSLCLCAIKTKIADDKIPFAEGYLFHELGGSSNKLYYGRTFETAQEIGTPSFDPRDYVLAVSPKDGRVIAGLRNTRGALKVFDGTTTTTVFGSSATKPMGWLYNSGIDFVVDSNNVEHCIFAEYYSHSGSEKIGNLYVWRGTYPYTSESDWSIVLIATDNTGNTNYITHFHQARRDPWTGIVYVTSGDTTEQAKWWYSTDDGQNFSLLTTDQTSGWPEQTCRIINFIFSAEYVYFATDHGTNHCLSRIQRDGSTGVLKISTREKLTDLVWGQATNSICYVENPEGIFCFDRIDIGAEYQELYGTGVTLSFWSLEQNELLDLGYLKLTNNSWGGHRGKCYTNYTNGQEPRPAMGYSEDTPCVFDLVGASDGIGTLFYDM